MYEQKKNHPSWRRKTLVNGDNVFDVWAPAGDPAKRRVKSLTKCLSPVTVKSPWYRKTGYDKALELVPCGKCYACRRVAALQMQFRLEQEWKYHKFGAFCCLTYDDEHLPLSTTETDYGYQSMLVREHLETFLRAMKDLVRRKYKDDFRYYAIGEYGTSDDCTHRAHYHFIYFTDSYKFHQNAINHFFDHWPNGRIDVGYLDSSSIGYITHDMMKEHDTSKKRHNFIDDMYVPDWCKMMNIPAPFATWSRNPFLGYQYLEPGRIFHTSDREHNSYVTLFSGVKCPIPRIYVEKYFHKRKATPWGHSEYLKRRMERDEDYTTCEAIRRELGLGYSKRDNETVFRIYNERYDPKRAADLAIRTANAKRH